MSVHDVYSIYRFYPEDSQPFSTAPKVQRKTFLPSSDIMFTLHALLTLVPNMHANPAKIVKHFSLRHSNDIGKQAKIISSEKYVREMLFPGSLGFRYESTHDKMRH